MVTIRTFSAPAAADIYAVQSKETAHAFIDNVHVNELAPVATLVSHVVDCIESPLFIVDTTARIAFKNKAASGILGAEMGLLMHDGGLQLICADAHARLLAHLKDAAMSSARTKCRAFSYSYTGAKLVAWTVLISTLTSTDEQDCSAQFLVQFVEPWRLSELPYSLLEQAFDLTPREVEIVAQLFQQESLSEVASCLKLSRETVKAHVKNIFRKCDVDSRAELVTLLQRLSLFEQC